MEISWETFLSKLEHPLRTGESFVEYQRLPKAEKAKRKRPPADSSAALLTVGVEWPVRWSSGGW